MKYLTPIHIVEAKRTAVGRLSGSLAEFTAPDLAVAAANAVLPEERSIVDQVIFGQVLQAGAGMNLARQVAIRAGLQEETPGYTVNMVCGSGLKAVALGTLAIEGGEAGVVLCGGAESMTKAPHLMKDLRGGKKYGPAVVVDSIDSEGLSDPLLGILMGETAERIAESYGITREEQDNWAARSQQLAVAAREAFSREIVPLAATRGLVDFDEHPRPDTTLERLAKLKPVFRKDGTVTAGNASGLNDGAAAVLLANEVALHQEGLTSRARIVGSASVGCDPALMGMGPVGAILRLCGELDWDLAEVDAVEINEAFAVQILACARELNLDHEKLNRRGGAIALGHPIGASGARLLVTLLHLLEDTGGRRGIVSLCIGGGMGIAMAIERE